MIQPTDHKSFRSESLNIYHVMGNDYELASVYVEERERLRERSKHSRNIH